MKIPLNETINIPEGVSASLNNNILIIKGNKGEVTKEFLHPKIILKIDSNKISLDCNIATRREKKIIYSWMAHINNMIRGVQEKFKYVLKVCSGHFPMNITLSNDLFSVKNFFGEKHARVLKIKKDAEVKINGDIITVESCNKETAGNIASDLELLTSRRGRDLRIFQDGIYITKKPSKKVDE